MATRTTTATSSRSASRAASADRTRVLDELKADHQRVKKAYKEFQKLDVEQDGERCEEIVRQVCAELSVHAALEEELLYPAAHGQIADEDLVDEAEVEHESVHTLVDQLKAMSVGDEKFAARFTVLCEYVNHHVKEEENEMFPQLEKAKLDWTSIATAMDSRRQELMAQEGLLEEAEVDADVENPSDDAPARKRSSTATRRR